VIALRTIVLRPRRAVRRRPVTFINRRGILGPDSLAVRMVLLRSMATGAGKKRSKRGRSEFIDFGLDWAPVGWTKPVR